MTVFEIFNAAQLSHQGPVRWTELISQPGPGVYVVARISDPHQACEHCELPLIDPIPDAISLDLDFENARWLPTEPILYIGQTRQAIDKRVRDFYRHKCVNPSPHAGGQIVHLLACALWVFWAPSTDPYKTEQAMLRAFEERVGHRPFANFDGRRSPRRIRTVKPH
jgi:hypothetical protein